MTDEPGSASSSGVEGWIERLAELAARDDEQGRATFDAELARADAVVDRDELVAALRERVMQAVRTAPPEALALSIALMRAAEGRDEWVGPACRARAVALHFNGQSREAVPPFERALAWYEARGDALDAARVRRSLVDVYQMAGDSERALAVADEARGSLEQLGERHLLAQLECNVGNVHFRLDRYSEASRFYRRALEVFRELEDDFGCAHALFNLGNIETNAHRFDDAIQSFTSAQPAFRRGGHEVLAVDCDYSMGYLELRRGRVSEAHRALTRAREGYLAGGKPSGPVLCDLDLAELHLRIDAYRDAVLHARRAIDGASELDMAYESAKARLFLGIALSQLEERERAQEELERAARELRALDNRTLGALATLHRVPLMRDRRDALQVLAEVEEATRDLQASGDDFLAQFGELALSDALLRAGSRERGLELLERLAARGAPESLAEGGLLNVRIEGLRALARECLAEGEVARAEALLRDAVAWIDATMTRLSNGDARIAFFSKRQPAFAELAALLLRTDSPEATLEAIGLVERSRSRNLQEATESGESPRVRELRERLDVLMCEDLERVLGGAPRTPHRRTESATHAELSRVREELMRAQREERSEHVVRAESAAKAPSIELPPLGERERVLYYFEARGEQYGVLLARRAGEATRVLRVARLAMPVRGRGGVREHLSRLRFHVEKYRHGRRYSERHAAQVRRAIERSLQALGSALVAPFFDSDRRGTPLEAGDELVVVPFGALHEVPFAGLAWDGECLVSRVDVSIARSLQQLQAEGESTLANRRVLSCVGAAEDLPAIERERGAFESWGEAQLEPVAVDGFLERLSGEAGEAVIHLAAHGNFEPDHPLFSGVRLGQRFLTAFDISRLRLPERLVLLSGCETGRQANTSGEELYGPEQSFFRAGARGVISCLWPIEDEAGADWITRVAAELEGGASARMAVSLAQRAAMRAGAPPQDWAGFVYTGDPQLRVPALARG